MCCFEVSYQCSNFLLVAIDMSPAQNSLLELKIAAITKLNHKDFLCILGEIPGQPNKR